MAYVDEGGGSPYTGLPTFNSKVTTLPGFDPTKTTLPKASGPPGSTPIQSSAPGEGAYQESQAAAEQAYSDALAGIQAQKNQAYLRYGFNSDGTVDPTNNYGLYQQNEHSFDTGMQRENQGYQSLLSGLDTQTGRENQDYGNTAADLQTALSRMQSQSGLQEQAGGGLGLTAGANGDYQQMLTDQARSLGSLADSEVSRGFVGAGVGARGLANAESDNSNQRSNYRSQLLNSMVDNHTSSERALLQHTRSLQDLSTQRTNALTQHGNALSDLTYNHGLGQQNLGLDFNDLKDGWDSQAVQAFNTKTGALHDARLQQLLAALTGG